MELCRGGDSTSLCIQNKPFNQYFLNSVQDKPGKSSVVTEPRSVLQKEL